MVYKGFILSLLAVVASAQVRYNHSEIDWKTIETDHFKIHYYDATEMSARETATVAETIYPSVTSQYQFQPFAKTDIIITDTDDFSNGVTYYYDNKIVIWATPLDFELRGSHRWLQNVITHEFAHIVSIQSALKFGQKIPGAYLQYIQYEKDKRKDVLYGYPNVIVSYPIPGMVIPPWLAEGAAQYMYDGADWDNWDTIRDMLLRDRTLNGQLLTWADMNTFGKTGIGNESVYNTGYALCRYLAVKYGPESISKVFSALRSPIGYSINHAVKSSTGKDGIELYRQFKTVLEKRYSVLTNNIMENQQTGRILVEKGTANLFPRWAPDGKHFAFLSNVNHDRFGETDLYVYDLESKKETLIVRGVHSRPSWNPDGTVLYYSRRAKWPDRTGSKYYDLFEYHVKYKKSYRLTSDARAFAPVFIPDDSSLVYLATTDGSQNIYKIDLKNKSSEVLTQFNDHQMISSLSYDSLNKWVLFDVTLNHFRDIRYLSLVDSTLGSLLTSPEWDERNPIASNNGLIYADDRSGVFNLYLIKEQEQGYITNVLGGAFMPDVSSEGKILYSLYQNGQYKIAIIDSIELIDENVVGYSSVYFQRNQNLKPPVAELDQKPSEPYIDHFPPLFLAPRILVDYGTVKPGFYFYSSEILDRLGLFGGISVNRFKDLDIFFQFEYRRLYPTLFFEMFYQTRNSVEKSSYSVYRIDSNLRFRLLQFRGGLKIPVVGTELSVFSSWNRYRAAIKERVLGQSLETGVGYDYFRGSDIGLLWRLENIEQRIDASINPSRGFRIQLSGTHERNQFIRGLNLSDAGTLVPEYSPNNLDRVAGNVSYYLEIPGTNRMTISLGNQLGWISNSKVDSFFYSYAGGMPGLRGYPYYSLGGTRKWVGDFNFRIPLFREQDYSLGWFTLQQSVIGFIVQAGDAWNPELSSFNLKRSAGVQFKLQGYSFYNYPTSIGVEVHRSFDKITLNTGGTQLTYGKDIRTYLTILFNF